jgi:transposase
MNSRKYNTDPKTLLEQGKLIMTSSDESKFLFRVFAVNMVLSGCSASQIGSMAGYSKAAVTGWVKKVDEQGFEALHTKHHPGRPPKLSDEQLSTIDSALQDDPKKYGFKIWDGPSLSSFIDSKFNIQISIRQCQRLFHDLGYSRIRPQSYPSKGYEDTDERNEFKKNDPE